MTQWATIGAPKNELGDGDALMPEDAATDPGQIAIAVRTLLAAGYIVTGSQRQPTHIEIPCQRVSRFGVDLQFLVAITASKEFSPDTVIDTRRAATADHRTPVFVGEYPTDQQIGWDDFLEALGGAVPSWRALAPSFQLDLLTAARNELPPGTTGTAWMILEDLVADGFEFCFGRKVRRLGARRPGKPVSDMLAQLPDGALVVIDAKAARNGFDANWPSLRPLVEYVKTQKLRQRGHNEVFGAVLVSSRFSQDEPTLSELSRTFFSETSAALAFSSADTLSGLVNLLQGQVGIRNAVRWRRLLAGGLIDLTNAGREFADATSQRFERGE